MKNGNIFVSLLTECCEALNGGRFPKLKSIWDYIVQEENQRLYTETVIKFQNELINSNEGENLINKDEMIDHFFTHSYGLDDPA